VYNDKKYTIAQIKEALLNDYKGNKDQTIMQTMFQMKAPKYGNNDDEIDEIGGKVMETWCNECWKYKTPNDFQFIILSNVDSIIVCCVSISFLTNLMILLYSYSSTSILDHLSINSSISNIFSLLYL